MTLEVIRMVSLMLDFGYFDFLNVSLKSGDKLIQIVHEKIRQHRTNRSSEFFLKSDIEKILIALSYLLEFDENYFKEMKHNGFTRTYQRNREFQYKV